MKGIKKACSFKQADEAKKLSGKGWMWCRVPPGDSLADQP